MAFESTHIVPQGGIPAWSTPDGSVPPVGNLAPGTEVQAGEQRGDWLHVTAANGWTGWVGASQVVIRMASAGPGVGAPPMTGTEPGTVVLNGTVYELATIWRRFGARLIDGLIVLAAFFLVALPIVGLTVDNEDDDEDEDESTEVTATVGGTLASNLLGAALFAPYEILFVSRRGGTPGKLATGIRVISIRTAEFPPAVNALKRWAAPTVPGLVPYVGGLLSLAVYVSATWDQARRGWHDKFADTVVIRVGR